MPASLVRPPVIVLGAGPVGLAAALLLARAGHVVTVYEAKDETPLSDANSYPIGVNPRGQEALRRIDPALLRRLFDGGLRDRLGRLHRWIAPSTGPVLNAGSPSTSMATVMTSHEWASAAIARTWRACLVRLAVVELRDFIGHWDAPVVGPPLHGEVARPSVTMTPHAHDVLPTGAVIGQPTRETTLPPVRQNSPSE